MDVLLSRIMRRVVRQGSLTIVVANGGQHSFGDGTGQRFTMTLNDPAVGRVLAHNPELSFGETYMDGRWSVGEGSLDGLLELLMRNVRTEHPSRLRLAIKRILRGFDQLNTRRVAARNAQHHYDVGNDIYRLFLDADWQYSCAYWPSRDMTLEEAQRAKKRRIAAKLLLEPGHKVLDIGCGWGGMALYLAKFTGADVTGITLARHQAARATERAAGKANVRFRLQDYRTVEETFDRIVSVGMFEHVGAPFYDEYFRTVARVMSDDGVMLLHSIGRFDGPGSTNPFIAKYIFPGGYIPALSEVLPAVERAGLYVTDIEIWRIHYAETLKHWRERFLARRGEVVRLMDERFVRMWEFYLAGSEAAFRSGDMMVFQIQLAKNLHIVPLTRDYIAATERALSARDSGRPAAPSLVARHG